MTTEAATPPSRPRRRPGPLPVAAATLATFLVIVTLLAMQLRNGRDPALGAGPGGSNASQAAPKRVLVKRIVKRKVIVRLIPGETSGGAQLAAGGAAAPAPAGAGAAPVTSAPAPAAAAPAPAAAAPSAPAPVTGSS